MNFQKTIKKAAMKSKLKLKLGETYTAIIPVEYVEERKTMLKVFRKVFSKVDYTPELGLFICTR